MNYTIDIDKFEAAEGEYLRFVEVPELLVKGFKWDEESGKMIDAMEPLGATLGR